MTNVKIYQKSMCEEGGGGGIFMDFVMYSGSPTTLCQTLIYRLEDFPSNIYIYIYTYKVYDELNNGEEGGGGGGGGVHRS